MRLLEEPITSAMYVYCAWTGLESSTCWTL